MLKGTGAWRRDSWRFFGADTEQGLLFLLTMVWHPVTAYTAPARCQQCPQAWALPHYWGPVKPWRLGGAKVFPGRTVRYLLRLDHFNQTAAGSGIARLQTQCFAELVGLRTTLQRQGRWSAEWASSGRGYMAFQYVLPSPEVAEA